MAATKPELLSAHTSARPFLKWAGGKAKLLSKLLELAPASFNRYFEPMVGGGAYFFGLQPKQAQLSDANEDLIITYRVAQSKLGELIESLRKHVYEKDYYYRLRNADRLESFASWSDVERASRFIYLNKTCFNGLHRVNARGQFNVPFGRYANPRILDEENLNACSQALAGVELRCGSFEDQLAEVGAGDFVYFDPPYVPISATSSFTSYTRDSFSLDAQERLKSVVDQLDSRGAYVLLTNSCADVVLELYRDYRIRTAHVPRSINAKADARGQISELIVSNYES